MDLLPEHRPENMSKLELITILIWFNARTVDERLCREIAQEIMKRLDIKEDLQS